jgi:hypothetical protein
MMTLTKKTAEPIACTTQDVVNHAVSRSLAVVPEVMNCVRFTQPSLTVGLQSAKNLALQWYSKQVDFNVPFASMCHTVAQMSFFVFEGRTIRHAELLVSAFATKLCLHGVAESIHPGARIEVLWSTGYFSGVVTESRQKNPNDAAAGSDIKVGFLKLTQISIHTSNCSCSGAV